MTLPSAFYTQPIAHRGLHDLGAGRPENSPAAFEAAISRGYGIELDVQLTRAGAAVATAAAPTIKRVAQELGGKSANVILPDADFSRAVKGGVRLAMFNSGQACNGPTRMLIPRQHQQEIEDIVAKTVASIVVGDPKDDKTYMGPIANRAQYERVIAFIQRAIDEGARLLVGGPERPAGLDKGFYVKPTVFTDVRNDMLTAREEAFGPVLALIPYESEEDAIAIANDNPYGLSSYVQSGDLDHARRVGRRIRAGHVELNGARWDQGAPFGGYRKSGNGREHGAWGLEEFLETKALLGYNA